MPGLIEITGLTRDITPGLTYPVTFNLEQNGTVTVQVPVDAEPLAERHEGQATPVGSDFGDSLAVVAGALVAR
ncbi:hypothetical protein [Nocardia sp. NPDC005998]|uniref:hypothetical protein n=1 Tax=Nocardia sp. NPDC005998 TaxID=3156894 RepID=UPI0033A69B2B